MRRAWRLSWHSRAVEVSGCQAFSRELVRGQAPDTRSFTSKIAWRGNSPPLAAAWVSLVVVDREACGEASQGEASSRRAAAPTCLDLIAAISACPMPDSLALMRVMGACGIWSRNAARTADSTRPGGLCRLPC